MVLVASSVDATVQTKLCYRRRSAGDDGGGFTERCSVAYLTDVSLPCLGQCDCFSCSSADEGNTFDISLALCENGCVSIEFVGRRKILAGFHSKSSQMRGKNST